MAGGMGAKLIEGIAPSLFQDKTIAIDIRSASVREQVEMKMPGVKITVGPHENQS